MARTVTLLLGLFCVIVAGVPLGAIEGPDIVFDQGNFGLVKEESVEPGSVNAYTLDLQEGDRLAIDVQGERDGIVLTSFIAPWGDELVMETHPESDRYWTWAPEDGRYTVVVKNAGDDASGFVLRLVASNAPLPTRKVLNRDAEGQTIPMRPGEIFQVSLDTYATAGYLWSVQEMDPALLRVTAKPATILLGTMPGAPVTQLFTLEALTTGTSDLILANQREWEEDPAELYRVTIEVVSED